MISGDTEMDTSSQDGASQPEYVVDFDGFVKRILSNPTVNILAMEKSQEAMCYFCFNGQKVRVEVILEYGVEVNCKDGNERTGLLCACECGHEDVVALLIEHGADVNAKDKYGTTSLMLASEKGYERVAELILKTNGIDVDATHSLGDTALMKACKNGHERIVDLLVQHNADTNKTEEMWGQTPLCYAVTSKNVNIVQTLLKHGALVDHTFSDKRTALMGAINNGSIDLVEILLKHGADVHITSPVDGNAMVQSCKVGNTKIMELLVKHGADVNFGGEDTYLPLMIACRCFQDKSVEFLLQNGADVNAGLDDLDNVLFYICDHEGGSEESVDMIVSHGLDIHLRQKDDGSTILMNACAARKEHVVKVLLKHGAEINVQCDEGMTPAMHAADYAGAGCLKMLIEAGANLDVRDYKGRTVLSWVMKNDYNPEPSFELLLKEGLLLEGGQLKLIHKNANYRFSHSKAVLATMELGLFEWEFCSVHCFKPVCFAALKSGFCPGKITYNDTTVSPLILAFLKNDTEAIETFLKYIYYFPEDYTMLTNDSDFRAQITDSPVLQNITLQPMSLFTWSYLTTSKAISVAGPYRERCQRVDRLRLPDIVKKRLKFQDK